ncbi:MAG: PD40 domain-containing protein [Chloroflexi bacterium]|nr:PD40 domain-containing protein [Chloroflexota bacterium]
MTIKLRYILIVLAVVLAACGQVTSIVTETPAATMPPATKTLPLPPLFPILSTETPSQTPLPTITPWPTVTPVTFTPTPPSSFPLDGYILIFRKGGNLYFQDGNNSPVQLTHGGEEPRFPIVSDDSRKIVFTTTPMEFSDEGYLNIYSVNADGSKEQGLITEQWLDTLGKGTKAYLPTFVHGTHKLLFNTRLCGSEEYDPPCSIGLYLVDTDTGEILEFIHPGETRQYDRNGNFKISPDGKMVSVFAPGHMDIYDMSGKVIRGNILPYTPSTPLEIFPIQYWLPDSSGLILTMPNVIKYALATSVSFTVWRYTLTNNVLVQILFDPPPTRGPGGCFDIVRASPDGKWIFYDGYMGNLDNGSTQLFGAGTCFMEPSPWSPDSKYIAYDNYYLAPIEGPHIRIGGYFRKWIDANHFLYANIKDENITTLLGEIIDGKILTYSFDPFTLIKPK